MSDNDAASISLRDRAVAEVGRFLDDYITERLDQGLLQLSFRGDARIRAEFCQLCRDSEVKEYVADIFIFNNTVRTAVSDSPALQYKLMDKWQYDYKNYAGTRRQAWGYCFNCRRRKPQDGDETKTLRRRGDSQAACGCDLKSTCNQHSFYCVYVKAPKAPKIRDIKTERCPLDPT